MDSLWLIGTVAPLMTLLGLTSFTMYWAAVWKGDERRTRLDLPGCEGSLLFW